MQKIPAQAKDASTEPPRQAQGTVARDLFEVHEMVWERDQG